MVLSNQVPRPASYLIITDQNESQTSEKASRWASNIMFSTIDHTGDAGVPGKRKITLGDVILR